MAWKGLAVGLVISSICIYLVEYLIFNDVHEILLWLFGCLAFLPLEVLFVTLMLERALESRANAAKLEKLNVVIGTFFSEVGRDLLVSFSDTDPKLSSIKRELVVRNEWSEREFNELAARLAKFDFGVDISKIEISRLCEFLHGRHEQLLRMMENPNLLDHESFTDLLRAVFHVTEELEARRDFASLPKTDILHIQADINRAYKLLVTEWLSYMNYIRKEYPYLFHLAIRQNPFDEAASIIVK